MVAPLMPGWPCSASTLDERPLWSCLVGMDVVPARWQIAGLDRTTSSISQEGDLRD